MITNSKLEANRVNAQHSSGPRTPEGKAASSRNATTHGLFSATFAVAPADRDEFDLFLELQREELRPQGINEELVFSSLVQAAWKTEQVRRLEAQALAGQNEASLYARYAARFERAYYRALAELRKLQTERAIREAAVQPLENMAPLAESAKVKKQTHPATPARDPFLDRINAEAKWTMAQLRALKAGVQPPPQSLRAEATE